MASNDPAGPDEAARRSRGEPYLTVAGVLRTDHQPPRRPRYRSPARVSADLTGRRVIWQVSTDRYARGYLAGPSRLGATLGPVSEKGADQMFWPCLADEAWWRLQLLGEVAAPLWVETPRVWLDEMAD